MAIRVCRSRIRWMAMAGRPMVVGLQAVADQAPTPAVATWCSTAIAVIAALFVCRKTPTLIALNGRFGS